MQSDENKKIKADYIIEDSQIKQDQKAKNRSGFLVFSVLLILIVVPLALIFYDSFSKSYSIESLTGWYEGSLVFETTENDPEGYYDRYPEYLVAGKIPVVLKVESAQGSEGKLTIIDATSRRSNIEYRIWIEDGKLIGEPIDLFRDVETRLDLFGEIDGGQENMGLEGSLGIKDLNNEAVAVFNFNADRQETDLSIEYVKENGMGLFIKQLEDNQPVTDLSGLWLDMAPTPGIRFALFNKGSAFDPSNNLRIDFDQPDFILMYLDDEYEIIPYDYDGISLSGSAEYYIMKNGKIIVSSNQGSYLVDEMVFAGERLIKVKLGDIDQTQIERRIQIEMSGYIEIEDGLGYLYMDVKIKENEITRTHELMFQLLDV
ncbi:hypothetical protein [Fusibacter sp. JL216-2]|uniref:hypothetical protein n=1 Tax=Fusibacter sp. JL216-2 TaxID=3071453 RepID=UPI003D32E256